MLPTNWLVINDLFSFVFVKVKNVNSIYYQKS